MSVYVFIIARLYFIIYFLKLKQANKKVNLVFRKVGAFSIVPAIVFSTFTQQRSDAGFFKPIIFV